MASYPPPPQFWPPAGTPVGSVPPGVGPLFNSHVVATLNSDGRAQAFFVAEQKISDAVQSAYGVYMTWQKEHGSAHWNTTYHLLAQKTLPTGLRAITPPDGKLTLFIYGGDTGHVSTHRVAHVIHQNGPNAVVGPWVDATGGGGGIHLQSGDNYRGGAAATIYGDKRMAFFFAKPGGVNVAVETAPGSHSFSPYVDVLGFIQSTNYSDLEVARNQDGRLELFMVDRELVWHAWQEGRPAHPHLGFHKPERLGNLTGVRAITAVSNVDGRLEVFAVTASKTLQHIWQNQPNSGWSNWEVLGDASGDVRAIQGDGGRVVVFAKTDKGLHYWYQDTANHGPWRGPIVISPPSFTQFDVIRNKDGLLEVIAVQPNTKFAFHIAQRQANLSAAWGAPQPIWPSSTGTPG